MINYSFAYYKIIIEFTVATRSFWTEMDRRDLQSLVIGFYWQRKSSINLYFKISFPYFSRTTSFSIEKNCLDCKMASQLDIRPATKAHARILRIYATLMFCHERVCLNRLWCLRSCLPGFPSKARDGMNWKYWNIVEYSRSKKRSVITISILEV